MAPVFLDAYAMIEMFRGNTAYEPFLGGNLATGWLQLYETHYRLAKDRGPDAAAGALSVFRPAVISFDEDDIVEASNFRRRSTKRKYSYSDALGYQMAVRRGMSFLTGDKEFRGLDHVEFVK